MEEQEKILDGVSQGGRLKEFRDNWLIYTKDLRIIKIIEGVTFELADLPIQKTTRPEYKFDSITKLKMTEQIEKFKEHNIIEKVDNEEGQIISNIFPRKKKSGEVRIIGNFKDINEEICYHKFKQTTVQAIIDLLRPNQFMCSIDLKDAYYCISVHRSHRKFLKFFYNDQLYQFTCLAQGIGCAPRIFTKIMKVPLSYLRENGVTIAAYIDDLIIFADSSEQCVEHCNLALSILRQLGYVVNFEKSSLIPSQKIEHLGLLLDSINMTVSLNEDKVRNIIKLCKEMINIQHPSIRTVAKLVGTMISYLPGIEFGKLHYRQLEHCKIKALQNANGNYEAKMTLSADALCDVQWWLQNVQSQTSFILKPTPSIVISTDSCGTMWGAVRDSFKTGGCWSSNEQNHHINFLETKAILLGLQSLCSDCNNVHIRVKSDNQTAVAYVNGMGGSKSYECNLVAIQIWEWAIAKQIWISVEHVAGVKNKEADEESRNRNNSGEWSLSQLTFQNIIESFKVTPTIDLFASRLNHKVDVFVSWFPDPLATKTNVFLHEFSHEIFYAFPPFNCIEKFLKKVQLENLEGIIVVPCWSTQAFFPSLTKILIDFPLCIRWRAALLSHPHLDQHPLGKRLRLIACRISGNHSKIKAFRLNLWKSCALDGLPAHINNTIPILKNGTISVKSGRPVALKAI